METWMIVLISVGGAVTYPLLGGVTWALLPSDFRAAPDDVAGFFVSLFWPITLPVMLGIRLARWTPNKRRDLPRASVHRD